MMGEFYEILKLNKSKVIVVAKTYLTLGNYLNDLENDLNKIKFKGNIIFDFTLSNGVHADNRFMTTKFDGNTINDIEPVGKQNLHKKHISHLKNFYDKHRGLLKRGVLRKREMKELSKSLEL